MMGFDSSLRRQGIGITNMQSPVEIFNVNLKIISQPEKRLKLKVEFPVIIEENVCYAEQTIKNFIAASV
jgi:two-component system NarL family sensor kinase